LLLYRDHNIKMTILYRLTKREALRDLKECLQSIKDIGIEIESVTCDGAANIIKAVREVCPGTILQRCPFHIANEICLWLTQKPQSEAARELRELVCYLSKVSSHEEAQLWMRAFIDWHSKYEEYINKKSVDEQSGRWWYTHKMLHRSASHIMRAIQSNQGKAIKKQGEKNDFSPFNNALKSAIFCIITKKRIASGISRLAQGGTDTPSPNTNFPTKRQKNV